MLRSLSITGATSGLGEAIVKAAAQRDIRVCAFGRRPVEQAVWVPLDLAEIDAVFDAAVESIEQAGLPDALICCAASARGEDRHDEWSLEQLFRVNVASHFLLARHLAEESSKARQPLQIVFVSSLAAQVVFQHLAGYGVAKAALEATASALRSRFADTDVTVSVLRPGPMATPFFVRNGVGAPTEAELPSTIAAVLLDMLEDTIPSDVTIGTSDAAAVQQRRSTHVVRL